MSAPTKRVTLLLLTILLPLSIAALLNSRMPAAAAPHTTFTVSNLNDSGAGSLRQAISDANASPGPDVISITAQGIIYLLSPLPTITEELAIAGPGADLLRLDAQQQFRILDITAAPVTISDLTIQHGSLSGSENGAGIRSTGALTLTNVAVLSNTTTNHGAGLRVSGALVIQGGTFANNQASGVGGALYAGGNATIVGAHFENNRSGNDGGAAYLLGGAVIEASQFIENRCTAGSCDGGALFSFSTTEISATQFLRNAAQDHGGGASIPGTLAITNTLFAGNQSVLSSGGGLSASGTVTVLATSFISNTARNHGAAMEVTSDAQTPLLLSEVHVESNISALGVGGGLQVSGPFLIERSVFINNVALEGGALSHTITGDGDIINTLFSGNEATDDVGAALRLRSPHSITVRHVTAIGAPLSTAPAIDIFTGTVAITNTILTGFTTAIAQHDGQASQDYNLFWANGADFSGSVTGGAHSFNADPHFTNPAARDYHLLPTSPAIDAGANVGVYEDIDGDARPYQHGFDIGFDEVPLGSVPPTPTPTVTPSSTPVPTATPVPSATLSPTATPGPSPTPTRDAYAQYLPFFARRGG